MHPIDPVFRRLQSRKRRLGGVKISAPSSRPFGLQQVTHAPTGGGGQTDRMTDRQTDRQTDIVQIVLIDKRFPLASRRLKF